MFPYPLEVNCAGNYVIGTEQIEMFPSPLEVIRGSNGLEYYSYREQTNMFPSPLEVIWVSNFKDPRNIDNCMFPFPLGVNGGSYLNQ